jgi:hypothetical protein
VEASDRRDPDQRGVLRRPGRRRVSTSADVPDTDEPGPLGPCMLARWSAAQQRFHLDPATSRDRRGPAAIRQQHPDVVPVPAAIRRGDRGTASRMARPGHRAGRQLDRLGQGILRARQDNHRRASTPARGNQRRQNHRHPAQLTADLSQLVRASAGASPVLTLADPAVTFRSPAGYEQAKYPPDWFGAARTSCGMITNATQNNQSAAQDHSCPPRT